MVDQPTTWNSRAFWFSKLALMSAYAPIGLAIAIPLGIFYFQYRLGRTLDDFSTLWDVHDHMLQPYVMQHHRMPDSWHELSTNNDTKAPWVESQIQESQEHLEINFGADVEADWFIRVKSGRLMGEEAEANKHIRAALQKEFINEQ